MTDLLRYSLFHRNAQRKRTRGWITRVLSESLALALCAHCPAQILHPQGKPPSFEVAAIKPSRGDVPARSSIGPKGNDRYVVRNASVKSLLEFAYTTDSDRQIIGLSGWMNSRLFDIDAKVSEAESDRISKLPAMQRMDPYRLMQQSLLTERFHLKVHFETRELPAYVLVLAKGGPKMKTTEMSPSNPQDTARPRSLRVIRPGEIVGEGVTTAMLAELLERQPELASGSGRTVSDKTNLQGLYDWTLRWAPGNDSSVDGPSLFTALQEQLGLKLESVKTPVEVVVVDHIEMPSPD